VCVRATVLCGIYCSSHLGNEVIFYQVSLLTIHVTVNSSNVTQTTLSPSEPETECIVICPSVPETIMYSDESHSVQDIKKLDQMMFCKSIINVFLSS